MRKLFSKSKTGLRKFGNRLFGQPKIFCIGLNKTGTTSLEQALKDLGYRMGSFAEGELLIKEYAIRNFKPIIDLCYTADAFQDAPFSYPYTYVALDQHFPDARFLLTVRDTPEQWYNSIVQYHGKLFAGGKTPVKEDLQRAAYRYPGFMWDAHQAIFDTPEDDIYSKPALIDYYNRHNITVRDYFRFKKNFLEINVSNKDDYRKMCSFLGKEAKGDDFPWLNKT